MILTINTCIRALHMAAINRKTAFQVELAVGLGVFLSYGATDKEPRSVLYAAYSSAGYDCTTANGIDYKTVNRRINATAKLFEALPVAVWAGKLNEDQLLSALCMGLEPYEFFSIQDVLRFCSPDRVLPKRQTLAVKPAPAAISGDINTTGQDAIREMFRRASDQGRHVDVGHLHLTIPDEATRDELVAMATKLLEMAGELLTA